MNHVKTAALLGLLSGLLVTIGYVAGGSGGALMGLVFATVMNFGSWFFSDQVALSAYGAQPVGPEAAPELYQIVERLSRKAGLPMPGVYIIPAAGANAFATGRDPEHAAVAVTQGILQLLPEDELAAVIAHELSHVKNRDTLTQAVAATIAGAISFLMQMAQMSLFWGGGRSRDEEGSNPFGLILAIILAPLAASVLQMAISRTREFGADAGAAELTGNPRALVRALQRLEAGARQIPLDANPAFSPLLIINPFGGAGAFLQNLFSTHPATEARVERLMAIEQDMLQARKAQGAFAPRG